MDVNVSIGKECKSNCKFCFENRKPIDYDFFLYFLQIKNFIKKNKPRKVSIFENRKSDPLSEEKLPLLIKWLCDRGFIKKINIVTSGMYDIEIFDRKITWSISIDSNKDFHDNNRGYGSYDIAMAMVRKLIKNKQRVFVTSFITKNQFKESINKIKFFCSEINKLGAKLRIEPFIGNKDQYIPLIDIKKYIQKYVYIDIDIDKEKSINKKYSCIDPSGIYQCQKEKKNGPCVFCF